MSNILVEPSTRPDDDDEDEDEDLYLGFSTSSSSYTPDSFDVGGDLNVGDLGIKVRTRVNVLHPLIKSANVYKIFAQGGDIFESDIFASAKAKLLTQVPLGNVVTNSYFQ